MNQKRSMAENESRNMNRSEAAAAGAAGRPIRKHEKPRKKRVWLRVVVAVVAALVVVAGVLAGLFAWDRWFRYDDATDFQGRWYPVGSTSAIVIDEAAISFDEETSYAYELDVQGKTVTYSLGNLTGRGHYWFTDDRNSLVIFDGGGFTAASTALSDLGRIIANMNAAVDGRTSALPQGEGITALTRTPDPSAALAKAEAAAKAAAQAEAEAEAEAARAQEETEEAPDADADSGIAPDPESPKPDTAGEKPEPQDFANESMGILME